MNTVSLTGRLTSDPVLAKASTGPVCRLRLAVANMGPSGGTGYIDVSTFGEPGEAACRVLSKGWLVAVSGRLHYREWETEGVRRHAISVIGNVEFLAAPRGREDPDDPDANIPF
jgi:single stranded DNA-binding protein